MRTWARAAIAIGAITVGVVGVHAPAHAGKDDPVITSQTGGGGGGGELLPDSDGMVHVRTSEMLARALKTDSKVTCLGVHMVLSEDEQADISQALASGALQLVDLFPGAMLASISDGTVDIHGGEVFKVDGGTVNLFAGRVTIVNRGVVNAAIGTKVVTVNEGTVNLFGSAVSTVNGGTVTLAKDTVSTIGIVKDGVVTGSGRINEIQGGITCLAGGKISMIEGGNVTVGGGDDRTCTITKVTGGAVKLTNGGKIFKIKGGNVIVDGGKVINVTTGGGFQRWLRIS